MLSYHGTKNYYFNGAFLTMTGHGLLLKELTEYFGVHRETIYHWQNQHEVPGYHIGKFWKFNNAEDNSLEKSSKVADVEVVK